MGGDPAAALSGYSKSFARLLCLPEQSGSLARFLYGGQLCMDRSVGSLPSILSRDLAHVILFEFGFSMHLPGDVGGLDAVDPSSSQGVDHPARTTTGLALELSLDPNCFLLNSSCLLYTSPSPRDLSTSRMPSSA